MKKFTSGTMLPACVSGSLVLLFGVGVPLCSENEQFESESARAVPAQGPPREEVQQPQGHQKEQNQQQWQERRHHQGKGLRTQQRHQAYESTQRARRTERQAQWQRFRARNWQAEHRTWMQRGGYHGYRIPESHFRGHFGPYHPFHIYTVNFLGKRPRFQYGGYWFNVIDPWPENWSADWYRNDDVYIDYSSDGYYLYDRKFPGVGIAISVSVR